MVTKRVYNLETSRWLITGGCGFIGRSLTRRLLEEGAYVRILDNFSIGSASDLDHDSPLVVFPENSTTPKLSGPVQVLEGDIRNRSDVIRACSDIDFFVHLAGNTGVPKSIEDPDSDFAANVMGTYTCLQAARESQIQRFVFER